MKKKITLIAVLAVIFGSGALLFTPQSLLAQTSAPSTERKILYYSCPMHPTVKSDKPGNCPSCGMGLEPVYADDVVTNNAPSNGTNNVANAKPYPLDTCLVEGTKLDGMGTTYTFVYQGQQIKFCCPDCKAVFLKDPDKYLKKIHDAEAAAQK